MKSDLNVKYCCLFVRVSSDLQDWQRQVDDLTVIANKDGYTVLEDNIYDEVVSGFKQRVRVGLEQMIMDLKTTKTHIKQIYIVEISRLSRRPRDTRKIIDDLTDDKISIYIQALKDYTLLPDGEINEKIEQQVQQMIIAGKNEIKMLVFRLISGKKAAAKKGKTVGKMAHGYEMVYTPKMKGSMIGINEAEAVTVRIIYKLCNEGFGVQQISNILAAKGIMARNGKKFDLTVIHDILRSPSYIGNRKYNDEIFVGVVPALVDIQTWELAQKLLTERSKKLVNVVTIGNNRYNWLLKKNVLKCGCCGGSYVPDIKNNNQSFYTCWNRRHKHNGCINSGLNIAELDGVVWNVVKNNIGLMNYMKSSSTELSKVNSDIAKMKIDLDILERELIQKNSIRKNKLQQQAEGLITMDELKDEMGIIIKQVDVIKNKIGQLKEQITDKENLEIKFSSQKEFIKTVKNIGESRSAIGEVFTNVLDKVIVNIKRKGNNSTSDIQIYMLGNPEPIHGKYFTKTKTWLPGNPMQQANDNFELTKFLDKGNNTFFPVDFNSVEIKPITFTLNSIELTPAVK